MWLLVRSFSVDQKLSSAYPHIRYAHKHGVTRSLHERKDADIQERLMLRSRLCPSVVKNPSSQFVFLQLSFSTVEKPTV